ncbi:outer membrane beta-barrel protein [Bradyrhizobium sp. KBS0727]|uniref:outer membrane protein n=1 Tax=unclassified Bradyrhizobium TaxID=2631580 RepID=UPI00110D6085|nr:MULTISPECIES: outer membrane beta-barrel protein [unclassified Bradyrhizobium]QDW38679.1 outer membrane beta-barrel protein [Bradyrhizobium sp. KBS0725]QDW45283.1 outer membrane beta-barrel protein [Bradyrhizobium sp. KBS0727]
MKKLVSTVLGLAALGLAAPASAADLAARPYTKAPAPVIAAVYDWSGFYLGINGGGGWSHKCWDRTAGRSTIFVTSIAEGCHDASGGTIGGQVGYRWQSAAWVFGIEAQGNWADIKGSNVSDIFFRALGDSSNQTKIDSFGLFTGQVGYSWNTFLLYVKGGAAVTHDKYNGFITNAAILNPNVDSASETRWGGVVGVGGEFAFSRNWSFALEYDHLFMGDRDVTFTGTGTAPFIGTTRTDRIRQDVDLFTARLNYRFGGPVIAKY